MNRSLGCLAAMVAQIASIPAGLAQPVADHQKTSEALPLGERTTGMAELGLGWLTLPGAEVCVQRTTLRCTRGDSSLMLEAWQLVRLQRVLAVGAGVLIGLTPTSAPRHDPEGIEREHTRRYLSVDATGRYYPYLGDCFEVWFGPTVGVAVVSDTFVIEPDYPDDRALVGSQGVTIRTEGMTLGLALGTAYQLSYHWLVGAGLRVESWFFPDRPARSPLGDEASLVGRNGVFVLALNLAYRIPL